MKNHKALHTRLHAAPRLLLLTLCLLCWNGCAVQEDAQDLSEPIITPNDTLPAGAQVLWDCVYFGAYPTSEVVKDSFSAVEDYAYRQEEIISDPELYAKLEKAAWSRDEAELNGQKYRRMRYTGKAEQAQRPQHYHWDAAWHYFRYEPIKWRILSLHDGTATLMADRQLDCAPYHIAADEVCWANCTLRSFLGGYSGTENSAGMDYAAAPQDSFWGTAFSDQEKACILKTKVETPDNYYFGTDCGDATEDFVYIPSEQDIFMSEAAEAAGFAKSDATRDTARRFKPTLYAMARGAWYSPVETNPGNGFWFVRTCGYTPSNVNYICDFGSVFNRGTYVTADDAGILPVIRIDLRRAKPAYAGQVSSDEIFVPENQETSGQQEASAEIRPRRTAGALSEPDVIPDDTLSSRLKTTWDCVEYGAYPVSEIVSGSSRAVEEYAVTPGDVIDDPALYDQLCHAAWTHNETVLSGSRYRRIRFADTQLLSPQSSQHYHWSNTTDWHYFRYEPIRWRVLECDGSAVLLLADRELDCMPFHDASADVTWADSTLRSFLNGYDGRENAARRDFTENNFIDTAFSAQEQTHILTREVAAPDNSYYGTDCGSSTQDKLFILSCDEVFSGESAAVHGFYPGKGVDDPAKRFRPTMYAMARGTWYSPVEGYRGNGFWYMRTNGYTLSNATYICDFGYIYNRGTNVACNDAGLLPAMWLDTKTLDLHPAGQRKSE